MDGITPIQDTTRSLHRQLVSALEQNADYTSYLSTLIRIHCPIEYKYQRLDMHGLIQSNNQTVEHLKKISSALSILEKYGRHLLKPLEMRSEMWRYIKFSNRIFNERIDAIKGGREVMKQMGYTQPIEDGLAFPNGEKTDSSQIWVLVADIVLARREFDVFFSGTHPAPEVIEDLLPQSTKAQCRQVQAVMRYTAEHGVQPGADQNSLHKVPVSNTPSLLKQLKEQAQQINTPLSSSYSAEMSQGQTPPAQGQGIPIEQLKNQNLPANRTSNAPQRTATPGGVSQPISAYSGHLVSSQTPPPTSSPVTNSPVYSPSVGAQVVGQPIMMPVNSGQQQVILGGQHGQPSQQFYIPGIPTHQVVTPQNIQQFAHNMGVPKLPSSPKHADDYGSSVDPPNYTKESVKENISPNSTEPAKNNIVCDICGDYTATLSCSVCDSKQLCPSCDLKWHRHPKRKNHERKDLHSQSEQKSEEEVYVTANFNQPLAANTVAGSDDRGKPLTVPSMSPQVPRVVSGASVPGHDSQFGVPNTGNDTLSQTPVVLVHNNLVPVLPVTPGVSSRPECHAAQIPFQSMSQQPDHQHPSKPCQSLPNTAPGGPPSSKLLPNIMAIPDIQKRKSKLEINLVSLQEEIDDTEEKIMSVVESSREFYQDDQYSTLYRKKGMLQRERMELRKYLSELESQEERQNGTEKRETVDISKQQIFYPPNAPGSFSPGGQSPGGAQFPHGPFSLLQTPQGLVMAPASYIYQAPVQKPYTMQHHAPQSPLSQGQGQGQPDQRSNLLLHQFPHNQPGQVLQQHVGPSLPLPSQRKDNVVTQMKDTQATIGGQQQQKQQQIGDKFQPSYPPTNNNIPKYGLDPLDNIAMSENYLNEARSRRMKVPDVKGQQIYYPPSFQETKEKADVQASSAIVKEKDNITHQPTAPKSPEPQLSKQEIVWTCDHCTFINTGKTRVCQICAKTTTDPNYVVADTAASETQSTSGNNSEDDEETKVLKVAAGAGKKIGQIHDQIYQEKMRAQKDFEEKQKKEKERLKKVELRKQQSQIESESQQVKEHIEIKEKYPIPVSEDPKMSPPTKPDNKPHLSPLKPKGSPSPPVSLGSGGGSGNFGCSNFNFNERMEAIQLKKEQEQMAMDGKEMIHMIKTAESSGFSVDELQIAVSVCNNDMSPLKWLKEKWPDLLDTVVTMVTDKGRHQESNDVGELSCVEAKEALIEKQGSVAAAVQMCVEKRKSAYLEIASAGDFAREAVLQALLHCSGDKTQALQELYTASLQQFLDRLWKEDYSQEEAGAEQQTGGTDTRILTFQEGCNSVNNSVLGHQNFQALVKNTDLNLDRRIRMVMVEGKLKSWGRAETVIKILDTDVANGTLDATLEEIVEAVSNCGDRQSSLVYLRQDCQCCFMLYPMSKICNLGCQCKICFTCVKMFFEVNIREKHVRNLSCPLCGHPDMEDTDAAADYLTFIAMLLQNLVSQDIQELYQVKLRDWHLQKDPNFRWCAHCGNGFIWDRGAVENCMMCPMCKKKTCFSCKIQWEDQHANLTCEEFEQWKIDNDPQNQAIGLAKHLEINGIDCPSCKMRYALAKGGCMHFKCPQCGHEFCSGCSQKFVTEGPCVGYKKCQNRGLHCHHPRDCFYYLRDNNVEELQKVLRDKRLNFDTRVAPDQEDPHHCPLMEQKEIADGKKDEACGKDVLPGHAGLCINHYKEYLVGIINKNKADPVNILSVEEMQRLLDREEKNVPQLKVGETRSQYRKRLIQYIKDKIPLKRNR